jgi:UPF0755 protein
MMARVVWGGCVLVGAAVLFLVQATITPGPSSDRPEVEFTIPSGASLSQVVDTLSARSIVGTPSLFRLLARVRGDDRNIRAGVYQVPSGIRWVPLLDRLVEGRVVTHPLTIPEGLTLREIAVRIAAFTGQDGVVVEDFLHEASEAKWEVPGPGLEGYLFPDTYLFTPGTSLDTIVRAMTEHYRSIWTAERLARAEALGMSEREITTLASIIQGEARRVQEMPVISGVFHNRLRIGYLLQADPTVQYALTERQSRLLFTDIDSVADHPYNTYTQPGLPPGPIGAPGKDAIDAALHPAEVDYLYFVARPDGTHIFTSSLEEHNRARSEARRAWDALAREAATGPTEAP